MGQVRGGSDGRDRPRFRDALAIREFRALWSAELLSVVGDQLARVALAVLVYQRTSSAGWTAATYALTFLPSLLGGVLLSGLADRFPRRELMVYVDLGRAVVAGLMVVPGLPLPVLMGLVFLLTLGGAPFKAAQQALLPTILAGDRYVAGLALRTVSSQAAQVAGFLGGGALLTALEPHLALGLNAGTFVVAAVLVAVGVRRRPAARSAMSPDEIRATAAPLRLLWRDRQLRGLFALFWLLGLFAVPEGIAAPYATTLTAAVGLVGVLMAADPAGSVVGAWLVKRLSERARARLTAPLAVAAGLPLVGCLFQPGFGVVVALWAVSGACATASLITAQASFVRRVPDHHRGAATGLASTGMLTSQGMAIFAAGVFADVTTPVLAVAVSGAAAAAFAAVLGASWLRGRSRESRTPVESAGHEADDAALASDLTSPCSPSSAPPPAGNAAEHGIGGADQAVITRTAQPASSPADQRSRLPWRWELWRLPRRVRSFLLAVELAAAGAVIGLTMASPGQLDPPALVTFVVIAGFGIAMGELTRHVERVRRRYNDAPHTNLTSVWTFPAALLLPPQLIPAVVVLLYVHLYWRSWYRVRGVRAYRLVYTSATVILACYTAGILRQLYAPAEPLQWSTPAAVVVIVLAGLAYSLVNICLVAAAITLFERRLDLRRTLGTARENALEAGTLGLGAVTTLLIAIHPLWILAIVPALLVLHRSVLMRQHEEAATTDSKTGLANAGAWTNLAGSEIDRAKRDGFPVGVLMVDVDHFKAVNDTYGHLVGDQVLQAIADALTRSVRRYDVVGRWGGEEFAVLCPETSAEELLRIGERICQEVRTLRVPLPEPDDAIGSLSVSIGAAAYPELGPELQDVLLAADDALFVAKDRGRNQVQTIVAALDWSNGDAAARRPIRR